MRKPLHEMLFPGGFPARAFVVHAAALGLTTAGVLAAKRVLSGYPAIPSGGALRFTAGAFLLACCISFIALAIGREIAQWRQFGILMCALWIISSLTRLTLRGGWSSGEEAAGDLLREFVICASFFLLGWLRERWQRDSPLRNGTISHPS